MAEFNAKIKQLPSEITIIVNLEYTPEYHIRRWIAMNLIKLAARILGCGIKVERGEDLGK